MKKYCLWLAVCAMSWNILPAEIKNGYEPQIALIRESLKRLNTLMTEDSKVSLFQKSQIKNKINKLLDYISYYELTETLLIQFRTVAPDLYNEIDSIKDKSGHVVNVFVKFAPESEMVFGVHGTTNLGQLECDRDVYLSEYGAGTVSVKIAPVNQSLSLLAHEFGHVKYQVPNLATYVEFYSMTYQNTTFHSRYIGHNSNDLSGRKAIEYENTFRKYHTLFLKAAASIKMESPIALLATIRKSVMK